MDIRVQLCTVVIE